MKTYIATKRTFNENGESKVELTFRTEKKASEQVEKWYNELLKEGYIITHLTLGRMSKIGEDVFLGYDEIQ